MGNVKGKPWVLAQEWDGSTVTDFFNGAIDELAIHDHVLTTAEMKDIYTNGIKVSPKTSIEYSYDNGGNILSKKEYDTSGTLVSSSNYSYEDSNWKDKLTSYNGKAITYDEIGNPLTYDGYTFTWEMGRQLKSLSGNGKTISYKYNDSRIRTEKTVNGVTTKYTLNGDNVIYEEDGTDKIHYSYGGNGLVSLNFNGTEYYYVRNAQGDIIAIIDSNGTEVVKYSYNTWGKLISIEGSLKDTVGVKNPYRYRGYRYDTETGLYYLNSRYYNPEWGRFINADGLVGTPGELLSGNMFAYCGNNPINREDPSGYLWGFIKEFVAQVSNAINAIKPAYAVAGGCAVGDGPLPIGDAIGLVIASVATVGAIGYAGYKTITSSRESTRSTPIAIDTTQKKREQPTVIYRFGSGSNTNLTPRPKDIGGLSFSLTPPASGKYVVTTMEAVNATGVLKAVKDGPNHVSVMPTIPSRMSGWIASRPNAQTLPHPYTVTLKAIVWDGK